MIRDWRILLALGGLVGLAGLAISIGQTETSPIAAQIAVEPAACSSCDARHANLRERQARLNEEKP